MLSVDDCLRLTLVLIIVAATIDGSETGPSSHETGPIATWDHANLKRLREMVRMSYRDATNAIRGLRSTEAPKWDEQSNNNKSSLLDSDSLVSGETLDGDRAPASVEKGAKNDARQSSLFSGLGFGQPAGNPGAFHMPPLGGFQNPLASSGGGFLRPAPFPVMPALALRPQPPPQPPRPPKSSIIGNGGGPMALTNDNVVVVNVFSNNYR